MRVPTVVIVGGGASGTLLAAQLSRRLHPGGLRIVLLERSGVFARGLAYSTPWDDHRLNVPAHKMAAFPRDAAHFCRWAGAQPGEFLPRRAYGDYLAGILAAALERLRPGVTLETVADEAVDAEVAGTGVTVHLRDGAPLRADRLVLAFGNLPPGPPPGATAALLASPRYHANPWDPALPGLSDGEDSLLMIGTGLTMVDLALVLEPRTLRAVSRTGLLPRAHDPGAAGPRAPFALPHRPFTLDELVAEVERRIAVADDWRDVIDSLRPVTNRIWQRLPPGDQARFVREVGRHWEVRRHRMAPQIAAALEQLQTSRRLRVDAADIRALRPVAGGVEVTTATEAFTVDRVVNCTGPSLRVGVAGEPLLASLLAAGHVRPGPFELGLDHDSRGAMLDSEGRPGPVYGLGPVRKGRLWETTAIPEIRAQALELADLLSGQLARVPALRWA